MKNQEAFVYCWTDHKTSMLYIGAHKGAQNDGYVCSCKILLEEYRKRPQDFTRQIVAEGTWQDCLLLETSLLKKANAKSDPAYYNMHNGDGKFTTKKGHNSGRKLTKKHRNAISNSGKKWYKAHPGECHFKFTAEMNREIAKKNIGRPCSEERRKNISLALTGIKHTEEARNNMSSGQLKAWKDGKYRRKALEGTVQKMSASREKFWSTKTKEERHAISSIGLEKATLSNIGTFWITNGIQNKHHDPTLVIPKGFWRGVRPQQQEKVKCPHCNKEGGVGNMKRYHFDNCKHRI